MEAWSSIPTLIPCRGSLEWYGVCYSSAIGATIHPWHSYFKRAPKAGEPFHAQIPTKLRMAAELAKVLIENDRELPKEKQCKVVLHVDLLLSIPPIMEESPSHLQLSLC